LHRAIAAFCFSANAMHHLPCLLVVAMSFVACGGGGGGGGGGPPTPSTTVELGAGTINATAGQLVIVDAPSPLFAPGIDYTAQWSANGTSFGSARVRAIDAESLALLVPQLPDGSYEARVTLPSVVARTRFAVTAAPPPVNAGATVAAAQAALAARATSLRTEAGAEPDAVVRAARLADLDRIDQWLANFAAARQAAAPVDLFLAATVLEQNPLLKGQALASAFSEADRFAAIAADLGVARSMVPQSVAAVAIGLAPGQPTLVSAVLVCGGLVGVAHAVPVARAAVRRPWKPIGGLVLQLAPASSAVIVQPVLAVTSGVPTTLGGHANFGSLAAVDRTLPGASLAAVFADLDAVLEPFGDLSPAVAAWIESRPLDVPEQRLVERWDITLDNVLVEFQLNPAVALSLGASQMTATLLGGSTAQTTVGLFRYETGTFGALTTEITVQVAP